MLKRCDFCIVGAGAAGLSVAAVTAKLGLKVILVEHGKMGGDCLNYGCVPSKALLAAAKHADSLRHLEPYGITNVEPQVDYAKVMAHVQEVIAQIAPHDSKERFTDMGVQVIQSDAQFLNAQQLQIDNTKIEAKYFVIATGSRPSVPPIKGLEEVEYLTNETIFSLTSLPKHLIVIGGGPIGMEMAQAHRMLGAEVTVLEGLTVLPKDDPDCVAVVKEVFKQQGIRIKSKVRVVSVASTQDGVEVRYEHDGVTATLKGSHLFLSTGRVANVDQLALEKAHVAYDTLGIQVDQRLRTTNKKIFAIGDCAGSFQFTHVASYHAGIVIRNAVFRLPAKVNYATLPWVTYTAPELANVGMNELMAKQANKQYRVTQFNCGDIDRYRAERQNEGFIKVLTDKKGHILGATAVAEAAGELILPWGLAIQNKLKITKMAAVIAAYPTRNEINKRVAGQYFEPVLYSSKMKKIARWLV